jgi:hypothetical protein
VLWNEELVVDGGGRWYCGSQSFLLLTASHCGSRSDHVYAPQALRQKDNRTKTQPKNHSLKVYRGLLFALGNLALWFGLDYLLGLSYDDALVWWECYDCLGQESAE